jgi:hypothetical protein
MARFVMRAGHGRIIFFPVSQPAACRSAWLARQLEIMQRTGDEPGAGTGRMGTREVVAAANSAGAHQGRLRGLAMQLGHRFQVGPGARADAL